MINRFIRNFLNSQHIIREIQHVQAVRVAFLHQCAKNVCPPVVLSCGARAASSSNLFQVTNLAKHVLVFAQDPRGSRFIQQTLECASPMEKARLVDALRGHVLTLALHMNGSHVIQMALKLVDKASQEIINEISAQVIPLSLNKYGCWVIRSVLEHCTEQQKRPVLEQLHDKVLTLITDPYGSFVIQHVIKQGLPDDRERIVRSLHEDILKHAQHKFGSLVIRKCLICGTADQKKALFDNVCVGGPETLQNARQLMADEFGHYVIQKCFEYGTDDQKAKLVDALRGHVLTLALQMNGSYVIQTALKSVDKASQMEIIEELTPRACVIRCIKDRSGMHVMNTIFKLIEPQRLQFVIDAIMYSPTDSVASLSLHKCGSLVIQRVLEHCTEQQKRPVLEQLHDNVLSLVTDKYGSHVIRHVKEHGLPEDRERIVSCLQKNVLTLVTDEVTSMSTHEYGSRVIRRVLEHCTEQQKRPVLEQIFDNVPTLVTDPYGCFVVEHVIKHGLPEDRERIVRSLKGDILKNTHLNSFCSVIEKCLVFGTTEQRNALIDQICADNGSGKPPLLEMMKHPFANDAVLKMHDFADSAHRNKMMFAVEEHIPALLRLQTRRLEQQSLTRTVQAQRQKEEAE